MITTKTIKHDYLQLVLSAPGKELIGSYTTKSGQVKNRYRKNPSAGVVKGIRHRYTTTIEVEPKEKGV